MGGHGRSCPIAAICLTLLLAGNARAQIDLAHPPKNAPWGNMRDLAPEPLPKESDPAPAENLVVQSSENSLVSDFPSAPYRSDATLNGIAFVDSQNGWAVGDSGAIWHTADGGRQWAQQRSGVDCRLRCVQFIDAKTGWVAGGRTTPYTHTTSGVILRTHDGGEHWTEIDKLLLPTITRIQFNSARHGIAIGQASALFPCPIFFTDDGGRLWAPISADQSVDCRSGFLGDNGNGALALADGRMARIENGRFHSANSPPLGLASVRNMQFADSTDGLLVGDGGLVLGTNDGGRNWQSVPWQTALAGHIPGQFQPRCDFSAVAIHGSQIWIGGSPGNRIFHSADGGQIWSATETEQRLPISAITFADDMHGWCCGALGTIEATDDGGRTWHKQRAGADRVALLGIFSEPRDMPLELFARASAADGYLCAVDVVNRRDAETNLPGSESLADRFQEGLASLGVARGDISWQFPMRQPGVELPVAAVKTIWDQAVDGDGMAELDRYLVRQIRMWRPSVIVTSSGYSESDSGQPSAAKILQEAIAQAVRHAADPGSGPANSSEQTLPAWTVSRVFTVVPDGQAGSITINSSQLSSRLGQSLAEMTWLPRGVIFDRFAAAPDSIGFRPLADSLGSDTGPVDFFGGLGLQAGGDARRELPQPTADAIAALRRNSIQQRDAAAILKHMAVSPGVGWAAQLTNLASEMDSATAGEMLFELGESFSCSGRWDSARQVFELLVERYPDHPLVSAARLWLFQSAASSVAERQLRCDGADQNPMENRTQRAIELAGQIERTCPTLYAEPAVRLPLSAAYRRLGETHESLHILAPFLGGNRDAFSDCAATENWLTHERGPSPKRVWHCAIVGSRPRLDGSLDSPIWQQAEAVELHSALSDDADWPASARLACDSEFLYLAVRCREAPDVDYRRGGSTRPQQADLSADDRIDLLISPDRDYATYYRISIDHRGWVNSGCWNGAPWQPVCYIAAGEHDRNWTIEAAIPWDQIVARSPIGRGGARSEPWAVNIQRIVPSVGFQSWSAPASAQIRTEGMGLLMFDRTSTNRAIDR